MPDNQITALNSATAILGTELVPVVQGGETKKVAVKDLRPYKVYTALLNQSDTDPPTATVLENTIGTITYSRTNAGQYNILSSGLFVLGKTVVFLGVSGALTTQGGVAHSLRINQLNNNLPNSINLWSLSPDFSGFVEGWGVINNLPIEIRVYN